MKKKKKSFIVARFFIVVWSFFLVLTLVLIYEFCVCVGSYNYGAILFFGCFLLFLPLPAFIGWSLLTNAACNIVFLDEFCISRRGLIFGFKCSIQISEIIEIKKVFFERDGYYYAIVDGKHNLNDRVFNNPSIFVPCTKKGKEFLESFYSGIVPPYEE